MSKIQQSMKKAQAGLVKSSRSPAGFAIPSRPVPSCGSCSPWPAATPLATDHGYMYRVDAKDTDALGLSNAATAQASAIQEGRFGDQTVWDQLKTVYDLEIPGNIRPHGSRSSWSCGSRSPTLLGVLVWGERNSRPGHDLLKCCHSDL